MLRITKEIVTESNVLFRLEGKLVGQWVDLLRECAVGCALESLTLDLASVTFADQPGLELLHKWQTRQVNLNNCPFFLQESLRQFQPLSQTPI